MSVCTSFLKTVQEKEKRAISSFPSVFYALVELSTIFIKFKIVVLKAFQFGRV